MWKLQTDRKIDTRPSDIRRLDELSLCLVIPWPDGFPQYFDADTEAHREAILTATAQEVLPWQL